VFSKRASVRIIRLKRNYFARKKSCGIIDKEKVINAEYENFSCMKIAGGIWKSKIPRSGTPPFVAVMKHGRTSEGANGI
jgi:hypothetical protein